MKLVILRHAKALSPETFAASGRDEGMRPLTKAGRKSAKRVAKGLRVLLPAVDSVAASPLLRAEQTAELIAEAYGDLGVEDLSELAPGASWDGLLRWLNGRRQGSTVVMVGHVPELNVLVTWLLCGSREPLISLKHCAACTLEFSGEVMPGTAQLVWALTPGQLRRLAE
jgi:phosphohistidine phosphatase